MRNIASVLVPVDFSQSSKLALECATALADRFGASIHVLHVCEIPAYLRPDVTVWSGELRANLSDHVQQEAEKSMTEFLADAHVADRKGLTSQVVCGQPYETIVAAAEDGAFDLIAVGTHGRTGLSHLILGSVAERVVRHSKCPVLTVRAENGTSPARS